MENKLPGISLSLSSTMGLSGSTGIATQAETGTALVHPAEVVGVAPLRRVRRGLPAFFPSEGSSWGSLSLQTLYVGQLWFRNRLCATSADVGQSCWPTWPRVGPSLTKSPKFGGLWIGIGWRSGRLWSDPSLVLLKFDPPNPATCRKARVDFDRACRKADHNSDPGKFRPIQADIGQKRSESVDDLEEGRVDRDA